MANTGTRPEFIARPDSVRPHCEKDVDVELTWTDPRRCFVLFTWQV